MSLRAIVFLTACWLLFLALFAVQFLSLGLIPVLAPVLVTLILGQVGLLQAAHRYAERYSTRLAGALVPGSARKSRISRNASVSSYRISVIPSGPSR
jgi:hypothetical protein